MEEEEPQPLAESIPEAMLNLINGKEAIEKRDALNAERKLRERDIKRRFRGKERAERLRELAEEVTRRLREIAQELLASGQKHQKDGKAEDEQNK
jgi:hypothetical protein